MKTSNKLLIGFGIVVLAAVIAVLITTRVIMGPVVRTTTGSRPSTTFGYLEKLG